MIANKKGKRTHTYCFDVFIKGHGCADSTLYCQHEFPCCPSQKQILEMILSGEIDILEQRGLLMQRIEKRTDICTHYDALCVQYLGYGAEITIRNIKKVS